MKGFFMLILMSFGVLVVFTLIAYMPTLGISGPWAEMNALIAPLILVVCFLGFVTYAVVSRK